MTSLTINAQLPAPAPAQKRKVFAFGLIHYKYSPSPLGSAAPEEEMRVLGWLSLEDRADSSPSAFEYDEPER